MKRKRTFKAKVYDSIMGVLHYSCHIIVLIIIIVAAIYISEISLTETIVSIIFLLVFVSGVLTDWHEKRKKIDKIN